MKRLSDKVRDIRNVPRKYKSPEASVALKEMISVGDRCKNCEFKGMHCDQAEFVMNCPLRDWRQEQLCWKKPCLNHSADSAPKARAP